MSSKLHTSSPLIFIDHSIHSDVYSNKNTQGLENGADKSFIKASILLHQRSDSCAEALHPINLNSETNASHFLKESTGRPIHSFHQDLSSQALNQDQTKETTEYLAYEVRADSCGFQERDPDHVRDRPNMNKQSEVPSTEKDTTVGGEKPEVNLKSEYMIETAPYNKQDSAGMTHQGPSNQMPLLKDEAQIDVSEVDSTKRSREKAVDMMKPTEHRNGVHSLLINSNHVENVSVNAQTDEDTNLLEPDDESRIRAELEMEIERDLEREIKAKIMMLSQRLEHLQSKRHIKEEQGKDSKQVLMGWSSRNSQVEHLKEVIKEETLPRSSPIEDESATQPLLQTEGSVMHPKSAPSSVIGEALPNISYINTEKPRANDQDGLFLYGEIPNMRPNVREFPSGIIDALLDKDVQLSYTETHTIHMKKLFPGADQACHSQEIVQADAAKSKHNSFTVSRNSTKANRNSVGGFPSVAKVKHDIVGGSTTNAKPKHYSFEGSSKPKHNSSEESPTSAKARYNGFGGSPKSDNSKHTSPGESPTSAKSKSPGRIKTIPNTFGASPSAVKGKKIALGETPIDLKAKHSSSGGSMAGNGSTKQTDSGESLAHVKKIEASAIHTSLRTKKKFDWTQTLRSDSPPGRPHNTAKDNWNNVVARALFQDDGSVVKGSPVSRRFTDLPRTSNQYENSLQRIKEDVSVADEECKRAFCCRKPPLPWHDIHDASEPNVAKVRHASKASPPAPQLPRKAVNKPMVWK